MVMMRLKDRCLLSGLLMFFCALGAVDAVSNIGNDIEIHSQDEKGNLLGASNRRYLDIREVNLTTHGEKLIVTLIVDANFPKPELMLGTGFRFEINFNSPPSLDENTPQLRDQLRLALSSRGWQYGLFHDETTTTPIDTDLILETGQRTLSATIPATVLEGISEVVITATTENYPKWTPVTTHPAILLKVAEPTEDTIR